MAPDIHLKNLGTFLLNIVNVPRFDDDGDQMAIIIHISSNP